MVIMRTVFNVLPETTQLMQQQHEHFVMQVQLVELVPLHDIQFEEMV